MLTFSKYVELVNHAGPNYLWESGGLGKTGQPLLGTRPRSDARRGLRSYLLHVQDSTCAFCDNTVGRATGENEMCHIIAAGPQNDVDGRRIRRGYLPGNIAIGCPRCNAEHFERYGLTVPYVAIARPDLVSVSWPSETDLRLMGGKTHTAVA